jgi:hypothetical protein
MACEIVASALYAGKITVTGGLVGIIYRLQVQYTRETSW